MMSVEIEPQYQAQDDDIDNGGNDLKYDESEPGNGQRGGISHSMMVDGVMPFGQGGIEGEEDYGDEGATVDGTPEVGKIKKDKVFTPIDSQRRKTKIIATLGPGSKETATMVQMMDAGMTMARLNLSHGSLKDNLRLITNYRNARRLRPHKNCAFMVEIRGREIRMSHNLEKGKFIKVRTGSTAKMFGGEYDKPSDAINFRVNSDNFQRYMRPNDLIYIDDGKVVAVVIEINMKGVTLEIKQGGTIKEFSAVKFTHGKHYNFALIKPEDLRDLQSIIQHVQIDFLAVPFIANGDDVNLVRSALGEYGKSIKICAKVDDLQVVERYDEILQEADAMIFAREDLQYELQPQKIMLAQKYAIEQANSNCKPIFLQSQVLDTMIEKDTPNDREIQEIASSTLEGADCFILSHETSIGLNPVKSMVNLAKAIAEAENIFDFDQTFTNLKAEFTNTEKPPSTLEIIVHTGVSIAHEQREQVDMIVCMTENGRLASQLAKQRPKQPILACCTNGQIVRQINMFRGVVGYKIPEHMKEKDDELMNLVLQVAQEQLICNLPSSKVIIFIGEKENDLKKANYTFKLVGGEKVEDDEEEDEDDIEDDDEEEQQ